MGILSDAKSIAERDPAARNTFEVMLFNKMYEKS